MSKSEVAEMCGNYVYLSDELPKSHFSFLSEYTRIPISFHLVNIIFNPSYSTDIICVVLIAFC